jgi:hypothetical protein
MQLAKSQAKNSSPRLHLSLNFFHQRSDVINAVTSQTCFLEARVRNNTENQVPEFQNVDNLIENFECI